MSGAAGVLRVRSAALGEPVLERLVAALAARADLPLDRLADAQIVAATLASGAVRHTQDGYLRVGLDADGGEVALAVGPLRPGAGERVMEASRLPDGNPVLERLVDAWSVQPGDDGETLRLTIGTGAPGS